MARFFKFKTSEDLAAEAVSLGVELKLSDDLTPLFQPVQVADRVVANRLAVQPMEGCDGTRDGRPDELTYRRYRRFGAGGAKLIWGEATAISDEGRMNPRQLWINGKTVGDLARMLEGCRTAHAEAVGNTDGLLVGLQLTHSGRWSYERPLLATRDSLLDPLTIDKSTGRTIDAAYPLLTDDDLKRIEDEYVAAAKLASTAGCDFIDLKQCHRYLLNELLAAVNRPGPYGGDLENRTRLIRNVVGRIRDEVPELILASRMNAYDGVPFRKREDGIGEPVSHRLPIECGFGTDKDDPSREDLAEPIEVARRLVAWGVSLLNVSAGNPYASPHLVRPAENPPIDGYDAPEHPLIGVARQFRITQAIQQAVSIPVVGSGYSWLQDFAFLAGAANVAAGDVAIVGYGRGTLSHPDFAQALSEQGKLDRKRVCRTFSYCTNLMRTKDHPLGQYATGCPPFDKEAYGELWKEAQAKLLARSRQLKT
ncbi:MAG: NADH:flavin oxidoreductase [Planctomycetaceae bacterium]|nr:NADH:flavin oxidoreductase [Planctomycetaceae bacterium]